MNSNITDPAGPVRPPDILEGIASETWQAYNDMQASKQRHFECLARLENKKKRFNLDPTADDQAELRTLLDNHDAQVRRFMEASQHLKALDASAHQAVFVYIGQLAAVSADSGVQH